MTTPVDERELGSTERGFLLYEILLEKPRLVSEIAAELGYASASGASNLLYRMRAAGLVRDDSGYWYVVNRHGSHRVNCVLIG